MTDILVRAIPQADAVRVAANAERLGLSQSEYLRRLIHADVERHNDAFSDIAGSATGLFPGDILTVLDDEWAQ